jgi:hypothetical protein
MYYRMVASALVAIAFSTATVAAQTPAGPGVAPREGPVADTTLRRAVNEFFPKALTGGMGKRPLLWFAADSNNRVLTFASGRQGLSDTLTWGTAADVLFGVPRSAQPGDILQWGHVIANRDTIDVIWVRLWRGVTIR